MTLIMVKVYHLCDGGLAAGSLMATQVNSDKETI